MEYVNTISMIFTWLGKFRKFSTSNLRFGCLESLGFLMIKTKLSKQMTPKATWLNSLNTVSPSRSCRSEKPLSRETDS